LSIISQLRSLYLCYFSKPIADRPIYRAIRRHRARKIVELGIRDGRRALRMIEIARRASAHCDVHYVGMDLFEGRPASDTPGISLKTAHQLLRNAGAKVQLVPGDPSGGLVRLANSLGKIDLLIVPAELDSPFFARMWSFVPRMLDQRSLVFVEWTGDDTETTMSIKSRSEIDRLAALGVSRRAA
jgi:hypothetical protein